MFRAPRFLLVLSLAVLTASGMATSALADSLSVAQVAQVTSPLWASGAGSGTACSRLAPCSPQTAVTVAPQGAVVNLLRGAYPSLVLPERKDASGWTSNITLQAAPGTSVTLGQVVVYTQHLTLTRLTFTGIVYLRPQADYSRLDKVHVNGSGVFLRSDHSAVTNSIIENGDRIDGIQIGGYPVPNTDVLIQGNTIRNFTQNADDSTAHADCIQLFDTADVTIRRNKIANCYNSGIIASPGARRGINNVLIESNFIQGCVVVSSTCGGGSAMDLRTIELHNLTVRNNTIPNGSFRLLPGDRVTATNNIIGYVSDCTAPVTYSLIDRWNLGLCGKTFPFAGSNRQGIASYVDQTHGDLHLTDPTNAQFADPTNAAPRDIDRLRPLVLDRVGADYGAALRLR